MRDETVSEEQRAPPDRAPRAALCVLDVARGLALPAEPERALLTATDRAAIHGDGLFETMLARRGRVLKHGMHLRRMSESARMCGLRMPSEALWSEAVSLALREFGETAETMVRLVLGRGPEYSDLPIAWAYACDITGRYDAQRTRGVDALLLERGAPASLGLQAPWLQYGLKSLSYAMNMAALRHARAQGADDAIFVDTAGGVLEGATSSVVVARHEEGRKTLITPPVDGGILPGTTQAALFAAASALGWDVRYAPLTSADLFAADGVWLTSSLRLAAPVNRIDGQPIARSAALNAEIQAMLADIR